MSLQGSDHRIGTASVEELAVIFPRQVDGRIEQDEEWCIVERDGRRRRVRFHDYHEIYEVPGLYEHLFYQKLKCQSPQVVCGLLADELGRTATPPETLRVLDVGAGNGMVGEELADIGAGKLVGVDIIAEAADATTRDRPGLYDDYHVMDLTDIPEPVEEDLAEARLNCLVTVAALGFGDIPPLAFANAYNLITSPGWIAFNIRDTFVTGEEEPSGFARLIEHMVDDGLLDLRARHRYRHRFNVKGEPLHYYAFVGVKKDDVDTEPLIH